GGDPSGGGRRGKDGARLHGGSRGRGGRGVRELREAAEHPGPGMISRARGPVAGLAGGVAWLGSMLAIFGPAQSILTDPARQSAKFLEAFAGTPPPRMSEAPWIVAAGILVIATLWGCVYAWLSRSWTGAWWRRGLRFGGIAWVLMVPWF